MINITSVIQNYQIYIVIALTALVILLLILVIICFKSLGSLEKRYRKLMRGADNQNIEEAINNYMNKIDAVEKEGQLIKRLYGNMDSKLKGCIQKISLVRYRAFEDIGSDQSFSVALLDEMNNGIILTGIFGRSESTTYAKPVDRGISRYELSQEETQVLREAMENRK
jgi:hypothetical protein